METGEKQETKKKRVSFAAEPQVTYIYPEAENKSNRGDSVVMSEDEVSVELTVDQVRGAGAGLGECLLDAGVCGLVGSDAGVLARGAEDGERVQDEGLEAGRNGGGEEYVRDGGLEFDNTMISNDTVNVEEIINTQDLRKMIPQARRDGSGVSELLVAKGIRFLDGLVVSSTRRDTISKSRNTVHGKQLRFYSDFVEPRTRFFLEFSSELEDRMCRQERVNAELEKEFRVGGTVFEREDAASQLRMLKTECRMRAKIEWYELRKEKELVFNEEAIDRKNKLAEEYNALAASLREAEERAEQMRAASERMEEQIRRVRARVGGDERSEEDKCRKAEELRVLMGEQEGVLENVRKETRALEEERSRKQVERRVLGEAVEKIGLEVKELEKTLCARSVTEGQLREARQGFRTLCAVLGMELEKVDMSHVRFRMLGYEFTLWLGPGLTIRSVDAVALDQGLLHGYFSRYFRGAGLDLFKGIREIVSAASAVSGIHKQLEMIRRTHRVEWGVFDSEVIVRIVLLDVSKCTPRELVARIRDGFEWVPGWGGTDLTHDLRRDVGAISRSVEEACRMV